jgi:hypothetical protein
MDERFLGVHLTCASCGHAFVEERSALTGTDMQTRPLVHHMNDRMILGKCVVDTQMSVSCSHGDLCVLCCIEALGEVVRGWESKAEVWKKQALIKKRRQEDEI